MQCTTVSEALAGVICKFSISLHQHNVVGPPFFNASSGFQEPSHLLNVVRASYRFLTLEPAVFTTLWDWSCFLDIVQQSADLTLINDATSRIIWFDLRWCSAGILSRALRLSFKASANLNTESEEAFKSYMR